jgi:hypothetical protein
MQLCSIASALRLDGYQLVDSRPPTIRSFLIAVLLPGVRSTSTRLRADQPTYARRAQSETFAADTALT